MVVGDSAVGMSMMIGMDLGDFFCFSKRVALLRLLSLCSGV